MQRASFVSLLTTALQLQPHQPHHPSALPAQTPQAMLAFPVSSTGTQHPGKGQLHRLAKNHPSLLHKPWKQSQSRKPRETKEKQRSGSLLKKTLRVAPLFLLLWCGYSCTTSQLAMIQAKQKAHFWAEIRGFAGNWQVDVAAVIQYIKDSDWMCCSSASAPGKMIKSPSDKEYGNASSGWWAAQWDMGMCSFLQPFSLGCWWH